MEWLMGLNLQAWTMGIFSFLSCLAFVYVVLAFMQVIFSLKKH